MKRLIICRDGVDDRCIVPAVYVDRKCGRCRSVNTVANSISKAINHRIADIESLYGRIIVIHDKCKHTGIIYCKRAMIACYRYIATVARQVDRDATVCHLRKSNTCNSAFVVIIQDIAGSASIIIAFILREDKFASVFRSIKHIIFCYGRSVII